MLSPKKKIPTYDHKCVKTFTFRECIYTTDEAYLRGTNLQVRGFDATLQEEREFDIPHFHVGIFVSMES